MTPWWIRYTRRWQQELDALARGGWQWTVDASDHAHGLVSLRVHHPHPLRAANPVYPRKAPYPVDQQDSADQTPTDDPGDDANERVGVDRECRGGSPRHPADPPVPPVSPVSLTVVFPAAYPFFPPEVRDPEQTLPISRHRDPVHGRLCLIHAQDWDLTATAAQLLDDRLPLLLSEADGHSTELDGQVEDPTPEPVGLCVPRTSARILVDGSWTIPAEIDHGTMLLGLLTLEDLRVGPGVVKRVLAPGLDLDTLADTPGRLFGHNVVGRWIRYPDFRPGPTARALWRWVEPRLDPIRVTIDPRPDAPSGTTTSAAGDGRHLDDRIQVIGLLVPSEMRYREPGEEWLFLIRTQPDPATTPTYQLFGSAPAGADDVAARTPATKPVRGRSVLVVGVGALGGTIAVELARAGIGSLDLLDGDVIDPATSCRQIAPTLYAGLPKAGALREVLAENNPHTHVRAHQVQLGAAQLTRPGEPDPHTILVDLIRDMDLVVDTAADTAVSRYLATICRATGTAFLHASATAGGHGGVVAVLGPDLEACWWCLLHHRHHHTVPFPPAAGGDEARVAPAGCSEPTFAGTGADLTTVAVHAARVAMDRLTRPTSGAPAAGMRGDLYVSRLRDHRGRPIPVRWHTRTLTQHPDCPMHPDHSRHPDHTGHADRSGHRAPHIPPRDEPRSTSPAPRPPTGQPGPPPTDRAATAHPSPPVTVTPVAGHRTTPAPARTLRTQQRTSTSAGADAGVVPDPNPARQEMNEPWPPATAPTPAPATDPPASIS